MHRKDWTRQLAVVFGVWFADYITKWLAMKFITGLTFYGPVGLVLHFNPGAMLGTFSGLPPVLRVVSLSTGGVFLFCIYLALQLLIPNQVRLLRYGMSILLGGILGNVTDRIMQGSVTDFLLLGSAANPTPAFNVADMVQWVGYVMVVISLLRDGHLFWPEQNSRKRLWVNPTFQTKFVAILIGIGLGFVLISGVFFFTYLKITIDAISLTAVIENEKRFLTPFFIVFVVVALGFLLTMLIVGRVLSHRMAGPLYAFEKFLEDVIAGKDRTLKLRTGDEFLHLEELAARLRQRMLELGAVKPPEKGPTPVISDELDPRS